jgi:hypothetical protein
VVLATWTGAAAGAAHPLKERRYGVGRLVLEHPIEVADVDAELERRCADDAGVGAVMEALLGEGALLERDGAVVHEHGVPARRMCSATASVTERD